MGDKNGNLSFWSVSFQDKLLSIQQQPERTISLGNVIQHLLYDTAQDCCFAAIKGEGIWRIPLLHPENRKFVPYPEHCRNFRKYRLAAVEDVLIFSCGKTLYQIPMHAESFCSEQIQPFLTVSTQSQMTLLSMTSRCSLICINPVFSSTYGENLVLLSCLQRQTATLRFSEKNIPTHSMALMI